MFLLQTEKEFIVGKYFTSALLSAYLPDIQVSQYYLSYSWTSGTSNMKNGARYCDIYLRLFNV
jgi:hypothetical protein